MTIEALGLYRDCITRLNALFLQDYFVFRNNQLQSARILNN